MAVLGMGLTVLLRHSLHDGFHLLGDLTRGTHLRVFRQPHVNVGEILKIFRKELRLEPREYNTTYHQQNERTCQGQFPMLNRLLRHAEVPAREAMLPPFLNGSLGPTLEQKRTDERDE